MRATHPRLARAAALVTCLATSALAPGLAVGLDWEPVGGDVNNIVYALASDASGNVYAGGVFSNAGGTPASYIARWDGSQWHALGSGATAGGIVQALTVTPDGRMIAGGSFPSMGGVVGTGNVAQWDGSAWSALGSGTDARVYALASNSAGSVFAGGNFGSPSARVAEWDGANWWSLLGDPDQSVVSLFVGSDNTLYAGGNFQNIGSVPANAVARWDGTSWQAFGNAFATVEALAETGPGNPLAAFGNDVRSWNGSNWTSLGPRFGSTVHALLVDHDGGVYAGSSFGDSDPAKIDGPISKWDGTSWASVSPYTGANSEVYALARDRAGYLYAGGRFSATGSAPYTHLVRALIADPPGAPIGVSAAAGDASAAVAWSAPASDGGGAITTYTATGTPGGRTCSAAAPSTSCTITGLANGTSYTVTVTATNAAGTGAASGLSNAVTPGVAVPATPSSPGVQVPAAAAPAPATPAPPRLPAAFAVRNGVGTTSGPLPAGATSVTQTATTATAPASMAASAMAVEGARVKKAEGTCKVTTVRSKKTKKVLRRTYRCTIKLSKGTWTITTTARGKAGVVARGVQTARVR